MSALLMTRYDATTAEILVFCFKDGLLAAVAHDLKLRATEFSIELEGSQVRAEVDAASLRAVCAVKSGVDDPSTLPAVALTEIDRNIAGPVLEAKEHPLILFEATSITDREVLGQVTLHGVTRPVRGQRHATAEHQIAEFRLDQRTFNIRLFVAMLGTLKVKPEVVVRVLLPR